MPLSNQRTESVPGRIPTLHGKRGSTSADSIETSRKSTAGSALDELCPKRFRQVAQKQGERDNAKGYHDGKHRHYETNLECVVEQIGISN
jgi:hypothetical protein